MPVEMKKKKKKKEKKAINHAVIENLDNNHTAQPIHNFHHKITPRTPERRCKFDT
jgi:hypothetical protein